MQLYIPRHAFCSLVFGVTGDRILFLLFLGGKGVANGIGRPFWATTEGLKTEIKRRFMGRVLPISNSIKMENGK